VDEGDAGGEGGVRGNGVGCNSKGIGTTQMGRQTIRRQRKVSERRDKGCGKIGMNENVQVVAFAIET
jgi:hypothetical protein